MMNKQNQNIGKGGTGYQAGDSIHIYNVLKNPSILADVVNAIAKIDLDDESLYGQLKEAPIIEDKIEHNNIQSYRYLINDYQLYQKTLEKIYKTLDQEQPNRKNNLLRVISDYYKKEKGALTTNTNDIETIRDNADTIIEKIISKLENEILRSSNLQSANEDVTTAISIIIADAFIRCKILEDPNEL